MSNKHAVFLRGHQRVWMYTYEHVFDKIHTMLGDNVDWYVAIWKSNTTDYNKILKTFEGKNLIHIELIDQEIVPIPKNKRYHNDVNHGLIRPEDTSTDMFHGHWNLAFLDQILNAKKCEHELTTEITYDKVLFTRPDVGFAFKDPEGVVHPNSLILNDFECAGYEQGYFIYHYDVFIHDLFYVCNSITADVIASRFLDTFITDPTKQFITPSEHAGVAQYFQKNHLTIKKYDGVIPFIFRPNTLYMLSKNDYTEEDHAEWQNWHSYDYGDRIKLIEDLGIDPDEYIMVYA